jgi:hypothetical protein
MEKIPASKQDPQPVTDNSTPESPKGKTEANFHPVDDLSMSDVVADNHDLQLKAAADFIKDRPDTEVELTNLIKETPAEKGPTVSQVQQLIKEKPEMFKPIEDPNLTKLRSYIFDNGFTESAVAMHIVQLCSQPLVTPATPTWAFHNNADIPSLVFATLKQPGYIEGIWPSLQVVMGSNIANEAWSASIATTIAFFDVIRVLPVLQV